jgi:hypothetical protein
MKLKHFYYQLLIMFIMNVIALLHCKEFHSQPAQHIPPVQDWPLDGWFDEYFKARIIPTLYCGHGTNPKALLHLFLSSGYIAPSSMFLNSSLQTSTPPFYRIIGSNNHMIILARDSTLE